MKNRIRKLLNRKKLIHTVGIAAAGLGLFLVMSAMIAFCGIVTEAGQPTSRGQSVLIGGLGVSIIVVGFTAMTASSASVSSIDFDLDDDFAEVTERVVPSTIEHLGDQMRCDFDATSPRQSSMTCLAPESTIRCDGCKSFNDVDAKYCDQCGSQVPEMMVV